MAHYANYTIKADFRRVPKKVQQIIHNPKVGLEYARTWEKYFREFMPYGQGDLVNSAYCTSDGYVMYISDYAHYMWQGEEYVWDMFEDLESGDIRKLYFAPEGGVKFKSGDSIKALTMDGEQYSPHWQYEAYQVYHDEVAEHMTEFIKEL